MPRPGKEQAAGKRRPSDRDELLLLAVALRGKLLFMAYDLTRNYAIAEEAFQESLIFLGKNHERYDPGRPLEPWLRRILQLQCYKLVRREHRARFADPEMTDRIREEFFTRSDYEPAPHELEARIGALRHCLRALAPDQRELLKKFYFFQRNGVDIAHELDQPVNTVWSHLHRLRKDLKRCVQRRLRMSDSNLSAPVEPMRPPWEENDLTSAREAALEYLSFAMVLAEPADRILSFPAPAEPPATEDPALRRRWRASLAIAAAVVAVAGWSAFQLGDRRGFVTTLPAGAELVENGTARVLAVSDTVELDGGETIRLPDGADKAVIRWKDGRSHLVLAPGGELGIAEIGGRGETQYFDLIGGGLQAEFHPDRGAGGVTFRSPHGAVRITGTSLELAHTPDFLGVAVTEGSVSVSAKGRGPSLPVDARSLAMLRKSGELAVFDRPASFDFPGRLVSPPLASFHRWNFDGNFHDQAGRFPASRAASRLVPSPSGEALRVGTGDELVFTTPMMLPNRFRLELRVRLDPGANTERTLLSFGGGRTDGFRLGVRDLGSTESGHLYLASGGGDSSGEILLAESARVRTGEWTTVGVEMDRDAGTAVFTVDTLLHQASGLFRTGFSSTGSLYFGSAAGGADPMPLEGLLDEVRLWVPGSGDRWPSPKAGSETER